MASGCCEACFRGDASLSRHSSGILRQLGAEEGQAGGDRHGEARCRGEVLARRHRREGPRAKVDMERRRAATDDDNSNKKNGDNQ